MYFRVVNKQERMIFYFTGTGNSRWVAETLGAAFDEPLISIADALDADGDELVYPLGEREKVFFVFPVHSWGPAVLVTRFISRLFLSGYEGQAVYFVCTCGDDCGYTDRILRNALARRGITLTGGGSVQMPNNYVLMPGFDVDSKEVEAGKLKKAPERVAEIIAAIREGKSLSSYYHAGSVPFLKSYGVYPLFTHLAIGGNRFYAMEACISCGLCAEICPTGTISLSDDGKPRWADTCVQCVACIHRCPVRAIEYGTISLKKGRYHHPAFK